jgi:hypothetical protein
VVLPLVAAWAVPYFVPGLWRQVRQASGQEPLTVTVLTADQFKSEAHQDASDQTVVPRPLSEVKRALESLDAEDYTRWEKSVGGVDATSTLIRLVVRGTSSERVTIQRIDVEVTRRDPPLPGLLVTEPTGGVAEPHYLRADLETGEVVWSDGEGNPIGPLSVWVSNTEEEIFDLIAFTEAYPGSQDKVGCDCHWLVKLTYTVGGGEPQVKLVGPPEGSDFRTTATLHAASWEIGSRTCEDVPSLRALCDVELSGP